MTSLYWDDFERRIAETVSHYLNGTPIPTRRVAVFITEKCNFNCKYCNVGFSPKTMEKNTFIKVVEKYPEAIIHITGGEPSVVPWLYPLIEETTARFHLNSNCFIAPPKNIQRLKVSLDSHDANYFNEIVGRKNVFERVVKNIKEASARTTTSITCTLTKDNFRQAPEFMRFVRETFPLLYAVFFSIYKGKNKFFQFTSEDVDEFFNVIRPKLIEVMDKESRNLFMETVDEKKRLVQGVRFSENETSTLCYISLSERVVDWSGEEYGCSHLYRDKVLIKPGKKHNKCRYGCNRRLVMFNEEVERQIKKNESFSLLA